MNYKSIIVCILFLSMSGSTYAVSLAMRVLDADQCELKQVGVGCPFTLEVKVSDVKNGMQEPYIEGLDTIHGRRVGVRMYMVNGVSSTCYTYEACVDGPGEYQVGPAIIERLQVESDVLTIVAGQEEILMLKKNKKKSAKTTAFLRFEVDEYTVVVGQKIGCMLRFYYLDTVTGIQDLGIPECAGFLKSNMQESSRGEEKIDSQTYNYIEWHWDLYPQQPGKKMVPACSVNFEVKSRRNNFFGGLGAFFGVRGELKRTYSNAVHLCVDPLPAYSHEVKAIGFFNSIKSELNPSVVKEGEGAVFAIEIEGEGNFDIIDAFALTHMPQSCKWYESKQFMLSKKESEQDNSGPLFKKRFEFIVQGLQPGHWEIPAQKFVYFDVETKKYVTLESRPVTMTVLRQFSSAHNTIEHDDSADVSEKNEQKKDGLEDGLSPLSVGPWYPIKSRRSLPWACFFFIACTPFLLSVLTIFQKIYIKYYMKFLPALRSQYAFREIRKKIGKARIKKDLVGLRGLFIQLFADRCKLVQAHISPSVISELLHNAGMEGQMLSEWHDFFAQLALYAFGDKPMAQADVQAIFDACDLWVQRLHKLL